VGLRAKSNIPLKLFDDGGPVLCGVGLRHNLYGHAWTEAQLCGKAVPATFHGYCASYHSPLHGG
jgi:hypothetical protein